MQAEHDEEIRNLRFEMERKKAEKIRELEKQTEVCCMGGSHIPAPPSPSWPSATLQRPRFPKDNPPSPQLVVAIPDACRTQPLGGADPGDPKLICSIRI